MPTGIYPRKQKCLKDELEKRYKKSTPEECWEWLGHKQTQGYGDLQVNNKLWVASRLAWTVYCGPIPDGLHVLHRCDNPGCVNPEHLFLGSHKDNMEDRSRKGRTYTPEWTEDMRRRRGEASKIWWSKASESEKRKIREASAASNKLRRKTN